MGDAGRQALIVRCERAIVHVDVWSDRDTPAAQRQVGECWALLKAGCDYRVEDPSNDPSSVVVWVRLPCAWGHGCHGQYRDDRFYLPTDESLRIGAATDGDWC